MVNRECFKWCSRRKTKAGRANEEHSSESASVCVCVCVTPSGEQGRDYLANPHPGAMVDDRVVLCSDERGRVTADGPTRLT